MRLKLYKNGELVEESGSYRCLGCGNVTYFKKGDYFKECSNCFAGTKDGPAGFTEEVEFWKFISE